MSTLNLFTGWNAAGAMKACPMGSIVLQYMCIVFAALSCAHMACMRLAPQWYLQHRTRIIVATRSVSKALYVMHLADCPLQLVFAYLDGRISFCATFQHQGSGTSALFAAALTFPFIP